MAYTTCFGLYHISKNIAQQETMSKELDALMSKHSIITEQMLTQATYTRAVMKEIFRMNPISVGIGRILAKDAVLSGYFVPAGVRYFWYIAFSFHCGCVADAIFVFCRQ